MNKNKLLTSTCFLAFPITMLFLLGPAEVYYSNKNEFSFSFFDFAPIFWGVSVLIFFIGTITISIFPIKIFKCILSLIFSISLLMYLQNMFFNKNIFNSDGSPIIWDEFKDYSLINIIIWIFVIILVLTIVIVIKKGFETIEKISLVMGILQLISYFIIFISCIVHPKTYIDNHYTFSGINQMKYGKENIIVILLDHYSNDDFEELLYSVDKDSVENLLHDFTYYNNANSNYNFTFPSVPAMLTGEKPDPSLTQQEWSDKIWNSNKCTYFYDSLHKEGYTCEIYSGKDAFLVFGNIKNLDGKYDNIIEDNPKINYGLMCRLLEKNTLYKYAPYSIKPRFELVSDAYKDTFVYMEEDGILAYDNDKFYNRLVEEQLSVDENIDKKFIFIHLYGMHGPYYTGLKGELVTDTSPDVTIKGLHYIMTEYISQLKMNGIYDSSTIIIMSDHGAAAEYYSPQPIFFIKEPNEHHNNMQINSAPIAYDDFQATILYLAGIDYSNFGKTIFDWNEGDIRERELWYPDNGYNIYTYTGNKEELIEKMKNKDCRHIDSNLKDGWSK